MKYIYLALFILSQSANANTFNLVDQGSTTLDQNSGLEWLDTSFTLGKSYNDVLALTSTGQSLSGWRFATYGEFTNIFTSRGYSFIGTSKLTANTSLQSNDPFFLTLINLLGATDISSANKDILGLTSEDYRNGLENSQYFGFIRSGYNATNITSYANFSRYEDNRSAPKLASFLVRTASTVTTPVPEPKSSALMLAGLLGMFFFARKRNT